LPRRRGRGRGLAIRQDHGGPRMGARRAALPRVPLPLTGCAGPSMEIRVIARGALSGLVAGILGFIFAKVFAEPYISKSIDYEYGRDAVVDALNKAAPRPLAPPDAEIFSRDIQSTIGVASGVIAFSVAMGALVAVAYLVLHGRFRLRPSRLVWLIAGLG